MNREVLAKAVFEEMYANDAFSKWLGIEAQRLAPGYALLRMQVRSEMLNGFGILHGGITYAFADSALAFASNSHGRQAVSIETAINHLKPVQDGEWLSAEAEEIHLGNNTGVYQVRVVDETGKKVAVFKGTVYRSKHLFDAAKAGGL
ncbi:MAG: PaaI family thioesterase [Saprospiraceae bacterium]|jgi:acyl-CoA thioesterase